jgi:uncharacterized damage-inducible protein DinB
MAPTVTPTANATLASHTRNYTAYNLWVNNTLVEWLKTKPAAVFDEVVPSSFPSLKETLVHIWDVERCWLGHLKQAPVKSFRFEQPFTGTLEEVFEGIVNTSSALDDYATFLNDEEMVSGRFFSIPFVGDHTVPAFEIIQHTIAHSAYHRGQLITIGRNVGLTDAPMTDYMFYLLRVKGH